MLTRSIVSPPIVEGRTLTGLAFRWDTPSTVSDDGRTSYEESFTTRSVDKTLSERNGDYPLFYMHPFQMGSRSDPTPLGAVTFFKEGDGLGFSVPMVMTRAADEYLELVKSGAVKDTSIGFNPINMVRAKGNPNHVIRTEIRLMELSLIPTGFGAHKGAEVMAVREGIEIPRITPNLNASRYRLLFGEG